MDFDTCGESLNQSPVDIKGGVYFWALAISMVITELDSRALCGPQSLISGV